MKAGRPSMCWELRQMLLEALAAYQYPATVSTAKRLVEIRRQQGCGWDTIQKCLDELAAGQLVIRQALPAQPGHKPLIVYQHYSQEDTGR